MQGQLEVRVAGSGSVLVATVFFAVFILISLGYTTSWDTTWRSLGVTPLEPHFFDMYAVTDHAACAARGYDAYVLTPCNSRTKFNYPPIWLWLGYLGIDSADATWLSILSSACAFVVVTMLFKGRSVLDGLVASTAILSPPVLMGVERGNIDLLILSLVGSAALIFSEEKLIRALPAALVSLLAVLLKLYPVFCVALLSKTSKRTLLFAIAVMTGSLIYFGSISDYLPVIRANTPQSFMVSYGYKAIFLGLDHLRAESRHNTFDLASSWLPVALVAILATSALTLAVYLARKCDPFCIVTSGTPGVAFLFGSGIYCGTFMLGTNFMYRLMFLLLCIPQLQDWAHNRMHNTNLQTVTAYFFQILVLLVLWSNGNPNGHLTFEIMPQLFDWMLLFDFITLVSLNFLCTNSFAQKGN